MVEESAYVKNTIETFGKAQAFLLSHFNTFNGIINPILPAKYIIFENNPDKKVSGDNLGDIVNINLHNIFVDYFCCNVYNDREFKGYLLYVLFHELLHLDQDLEYYYNRYKDEKTATEKIEDSCHALTFLSMRNFWLWLHQSNNDYFEIPSLGTFVHPIKIDKITKENNPRELLNYASQLASNYVPLRNPLDKVKWLIAHGLYGNNYYEFYKVCDSYPTIILEVIVNGELFTSGVIKFLGQFIHWRNIMDIYRIIIFFAKQGHFKKDEKHINNISISSYFEETEDNNIPIAKYVYNIEGTLDIFYKFKDRISG